mmetsp:Transcript_20565/g.44783  ORF Transcript_20565/g.44783 Transcript_20565/m.44783 type:complete len:212 (+) Transcript_20565:1218-1853(+)
MGSLACSNQGVEVLHALPTGDEFLHSIDDVVLPVGCLRGGGLDVGQVTASLGFCESDGHSTFATCNAPSNSFLQIVRSEMDDMRQRHVGDEEQDGNTSSTTPRQLVRPDHEHEIVPTFARWGSAHLDGSPRTENSGLGSALPELLDGAGVGLVPLVHIGAQVLLNPSSHLGPEVDMLLFVVGSGHTTIPTRLGKGDLAAEGREGRHGCGAR